MFEPEQLERDKIGIGMDWFFLGGGAKPPNPPINRNRTILEGIDFQDLTNCFW